MNTPLAHAKAPFPASHHARSAHRRCHRASGLIATEVELKLIVPASDLKQLKRAVLALPNARSESQLDLTSTYYDTPDLKLHRNQLTLRVRKQGRQFVQTVKAGDFAGADLLARREWEDAVTSWRPDTDAPRTGKQLPGSIRERDLRSVFTTSLTRELIDFEPDLSTRIEVAIDEGRIRTSDGNRVEPISEMELELKCGDPTALYDLALRLLEAAPVRIETRSKAERGYRLLGAAEPAQPVYAGPVVLDPEMPFDTALQLFGRQCLTHLLRNEASMLGGAPEGVHLMRVAVRRLRSVLSAVRPMLPLEQHRWVPEEMKWLTHVLGPVRNWDVLATDLIRPVCDALPANGELAHLVKVVEDRHHAAFVEAKQAILSERYTKSMLHLLRWFEARQWREQPISEDAALLLKPIATVAPELIDRCYRRARKFSKRFAEQTSAERHRLRIALKRLRYVIEFLGCLFDKKQVTGFVDRLKSLQDRLGHANDIRVPHQLLAELPANADQDIRAMDRAAGLVRGWHERDLANQEQTVRRLVRRFKRSNRLW